MRLVKIFFVLTMFAACTDTGTKDHSPAAKEDSTGDMDTQQRLGMDTGHVTPESKPDSSLVYANARFRNVKVQRTGANQFEVTGKGQIFEASFSWVIEDGHEQIRSGYATTDAGAPEWGDFKFTVVAEKKRPESTLHLVLFEVSAKDGSPQHELPVLLY
jgi:hypothetical protein